MADEKIVIDVEVKGTGNIVSEVEAAAEASKSLKAQLREATLELQRLSDTPGIDTEQIRQQAAVVGELKDAIGDANDMANSFSGNSFENMSSSLGGVKSAILNLDFSKANDMAKNFAANAKNISFGSAASSLKDLGSTFMTLGKSLLTNPLFLIGSVIALLVVAIVKVLDKLGVLKKITEAVGAAFDLLMGVIEGVVTAITDFLGVTSEAEREAVAAQEAAAVAAENGAKKTKNANEEVIQTLDMKIAIAKAEGKQTTQLEREKLQAIRDTAKAEYEAAVQKFKLAIAKGEADAKEIADLKEKARVARLAYADSKNDIKVFEAEVLADKKTANKKKQDEDDNAAKAAADKAKAAREAAIQKQKEYEKMRLDTTRNIEDLKNALIKDDVEREIASNKTKYERLIADTKANEKLLGDEKTALVALYTQQQIATEDKIKADAEAKRKEKEDADKKAKDDAAKKAMDDAIAAEDKAWNDQKAAMDLKASYMAEGQQKEIVERQNAYQQELVDLQKALDDKLITEAEYADLTKAAEKQKNEDLDAINEEYANKEKDRRKQIADAAIQVASSSLSAIGALAEAFAGKSKEQQRKAFKIQKGVQIAQATIDTFKAATGAYSSMSSIPVVGPVLGAVAAAAAVAAGIANIKKISSTEFKEDGGGTPPTAGGGGGTDVSMATPASAPTPPSITLQGNAMAGGTGTGTQLFGSRQTQVRSYVVESDITNTQNRLNTYQQRAEIG